MLGLLITAAVLVLDVMSILDVFNSGRSREKGDLDRVHLAAASRRPAPLLRADASRPPRRRRTWDHTLSLTVAGGFMDAVAAAR
jgi:hypothetical protein